MKRKKHKKVKTLNFAVAFCIGVVILILMSIALKTIVLIKNSSFDGTNRFNVAAVGDNQTSIISFSPSNHTITLLNLKGKPINNLSQHLGIPIDAQIKKNNLIFDKTNIASNVYNVLFHFDNKQTNLTFIDILRLWLFAKDVSPDSIHQRDLSMEDNLTLNTFTSSFFIDSVVANEKTTIEVINATPTYGLANRFATFISNIGADVVLVSTSDEYKDNSQILYSEDLNYTIKKISKILNVKPTKVSKRNISEVTVIIGKDILPSLKF